MKRMTGAKGWVYYSWSLENDGWLAFAGLKRKGKGYLGRQIEDMVREALDQWGYNRNG